LTGDEHGEWSIDDRNLLPAIMPTDAVMAAPRKPDWSGGAMSTPQR
jgi:hypothetical protein